MEIAIDDIRRLGYILDIFADNKVNMDFETDRLMIYGLYATSTGFLAASLHRSLFDNYRCPRTENFTVEIKRVHAALSSLLKFKVNRMHLRSHDGHLRVSGDGTHMPSYDIFTVEYTPDQWIDLRPFEAGMVDLVVDTKTLSTCLHEMPTIFTVSINSTEDHITLKGKDDTGSTKLQLPIEPTAIEQFRSSGIVFEQHYKKTMTYPLRKGHFLAPTAILSIHPDRTVLIVKFTIQYDDMHPSHVQCLLSAVIRDDELEADF